MARLVYSAISSLDGYVVDDDGSFDWAAPDDEVHAFVNELERGIGTYLYGRGMYETMLYWDTAEDFPEGADVPRDFAALWRAADKIVYSTTLDSVGTAQTRLERTFDVDAVRRLKVSADRDISVGGPGLAGQALAAGLVDECQWFVAPVVVGGGTPWLPTGVRLDLELVDERRFRSGFAFLRYRIRS